MKITLYENLRAVPYVPFYAALELGMFSAEGLQAALWTFPRTTAGSAYGISPPCALDQDPESLQALTALLDESKKHPPCPIQDILSLSSSGQAYLEEVKGDWGSSGSSTGPS